MKHRNQQNMVNILWRETPLYSLTNSTEKKKKTRLYNNNQKNARIKEEWQVNLQKTLN